LYSFVYRNTEKNATTKRTAVNSDRRVGAVDVAGVHAAKARARRGSKGGGDVRSSFNLFDSH
jgi:hypothetical protein